MGYAYDMHAAGGASAWLSYPRGGSDLEYTSTYLLQLEYCLPAGVLLALFWVEFATSPFAMRNGKSHNRHSADWSRHVPIPQIGLRPQAGATSNPVYRLLSWSLATAVLLWIFYLGSRFRTITMVIGMLAAYYLPRRRDPPLLLLVAVFSVLFVATNFQAAYRGSFRNLSFNLREIDWQEARSACLPGWLGGTPAAAREISTGMEFNCVMNVVKLVPERIPYNYGYGHLELFTRLVPRTLWPGKRWPHLEAVQGVLKEADLSNSNGGFSDLLAGPAFTFIGHWYYVLGPLGLIAGGLLTGVLLRFIRSLYDRCAGSEADILVYSQLIIIGFSEAAATPLYWLFSLPFSLLPILVLIKWCGKESPSASRRSPQNRASPYRGGTSSMSA